MKKINIVMAMDSYYPMVDGVCESMHNYMLNLSEKTNALALVPQMDKSYKDNFPYPLYRVKSVYLPIYKSRYPLPRLDRQLKEELDTRQIDIIHLHSPFAMCKYASKLARKRNIPIVATFHTKFREAFEGKIKSKAFVNFLIKRIGKALNQVDEVFVSNQSIISEVRSYGYTGDISIMPLGTDLERCNNIKALSELANQTFDLDKNQIVMLTVGRLEKGKNVNLSLSALAKLKEQTDNFKFIIVGQGSELENLQHQTKESNLTQNVIFTGFIDRAYLPMLYARADLFLFPSDFDTLGLVKIEASAYQTPTLTLENSCAGYGIVDGENGYTTKADITLYSNKLIRILKNKSDLKEVGKRASETLYINWKESTEILLKRYELLIKNAKEKYKTKRTGKLSEKQI